MLTTEQNEITEGLYLGQEKNRFICNVLIKGNREKCHLPFPNRLSNYFLLDKNKVLLKRINNSNAKFRFSLFAIKIKHSYILVNLSYANKLLLSNLKLRAFSFLGTRDEVFKEVNVLPTYKTDLYIKKTKTIIEIKTVIAFSEKAFFPQEKSERIINQLKAILSLLKQGYKVCYFICVLTKNIKIIELNPKYEEITAYFYKCIEAGMIVHCRQVCFSEKKQDFIFKNKVSFEL